MENHALGFMDGLYVSIVGLAGVFLVLSLFFITIRLLQKAGSRNNGN